MREITPRKLVFREGLMQGIIPKISEIIFNEYLYKIKFLNVSNEITRMYYEFEDMPRYTHIPNKKHRYDAFILPENLNFLLSYDFENPFIVPLTLSAILDACYFLNESDKEFIKLQMV